MNGLPIFANFNVDLSGKGSSSAFRKCVRLPLSANFPVRHFSLRACLKLYASNSPPSARTELRRGKRPSRHATSCLEEIPTDSRQLSCTWDPNPSDRNFEDIVATTLGDSASPALSSLWQILPIFTRCVPERARRVLSENVYFRPFIKCYDFSTPHFVPGEKPRGATRAASSPRVAGFGYPVRGETNRRDTGGIFDWASGVRA